MSQYTLHFDGSCQPTNPGPKAVWAYTIHKEGILLYEDAGLCEGKELYSNNLAEFHAVYKGMEKLSNELIKGDELFIRGDARWVLDMLKKNWKAKTETIYYDSYILAKAELLAIRAKYITTSIDWIPRTQNTYTDKLSKSI